MGLRVHVLGVLAVMVLFTAGGSSQVAVIPQPGTIIGSVELIADDVANVSDVDIFTVPAFPAGVRFKITDLIVSNENASASCCARIFTGPGPCPPPLFEPCVARTGLIAVPAGGTVDHSFLNGINFNSGQVVTVRNGDSIVGPLDFTIRGYLFTIP